MDRKIALDESFYGELLSVTPKVGCIATNICMAMHLPCFDDIPCRLDAPCAADIPCRYSPCTYSPCSSDTPCSDTPPPTTSGSITSITSTSDSITIKYTSIPNSVWYQIHYRKDSESATTPIANGANLSCTIEGLDPDTKYVVNYRGATATVFGPLMPSGKTIKTKPRFTTFSWSYSGINMSTGKPEFGSRKKSGYGVYVTADEWNELVDNANERLGESMGHVQPNAPISASTVNALAVAVGVAKVSPGEPVSAAFFNNLMDAVNNSG